MHCERSEQKIFAVNLKHLSECFNSRLPRFTIIRINLKKIRAVCRVKMVFSDDNSKDVNFNEVSILLSLNPMSNINVFLCFHIPL